MILEGKFDIQEDIVREEIIAKAKKYSQCKQ